ncbi:MAG TPA: TIGR01458 family HAD-type hydrolase [Candidatus Krumholzibacteria bacterium]|nr:TIGR01458 family HAD-type hydrolase [Candidatus Krumholzibacteria bacterium]
MQIDEISGIRGLLADMDGVWFVENEPIAGAREALARIRERNLALRIISNTSTRTCDELAAKMRRLGMHVEANEVISPPRAAARMLRARQVKGVKLVVSDSIRGEFAGLVESDHPDAVVIGDIGERWDYTLMNQLFHHVLEGAEIVALHRGRYWQVADGLKLDIGAFVAGLEFATGATATVVGKPSPQLFRMALQDMGLEPDQVVMIGDDIYHDVGGAQEAGLRGVLVKTGKYRESLVASAGITPDMVIDSIAVLAGVL